jgi:hypothetical protein
LITIDLLWGIWLWTITTGASPCDGPICTVATLNHHATLLFGCAIVCVVGLLALSAVTGGLSECGGREVVGIGIAAAAGGAALLGIAALLLGAVIALTIFAVFFAALTPTPSRGNEHA